MEDRLWMMEPQWTLVPSLHSVTQDYEDIIACVNKNE